MRLKSGSLLARTIVAALYPEFTLWSLLVGPLGAKERLHQTWRREVEQVLAATPNRQSAHFVFNGNSYSYFDHSYNTTRVSERCVEIPIFLEQLRKNRGKSVLELGNVLNHYSEESHDVVDKYELGEGVVNVDILAFNPKDRYDLAVSISTLEHIGWDYEPRNAKDCLFAIRRLLMLLKPSGKLIASVPLGHNRFIDILMLRERLPNCRYHFMRRLTPGNDWIECGVNTANQPYVNFLRPYARNWRHGPPYPFANAVCIFEMNRDSLASVERLCTAGSRRHSG